MWYTEFSVLLREHYRYAHHEPGCNRKGNLYHPYTDDKNWGGNVQERHEDLQDIIRAWKTVLELYFLDISQQSSSRCTVLILVFPNAWFHGSFWL